MKQMTTHTANPIARDSQKIRMSGSFIILPSCAFLPAYPQRERFPLA